MKIAVLSVNQYREIVRNMKNEPIYTQHTHTYLALRKTVGWIGILLPFTLMLGNYFIFKGDLMLPSISRYYHSEMQDIFVGTMCAMACFLFFYSGYGEIDKWMGIAAGTLAIGVAFFPTPDGGPLEVIGLVHYTCAVLLFLLLAAMSLFTFPRKRPGMIKQKTDRIQIACGLIMLTCVVILVLRFSLGRWRQAESCFVFVFESVALIAFGVSWLTEGIDLKKEITDE
jgi:hypothetical protein